MKKTIFLLFLSLFLGFFIAKAQEVENAVETGQDIEKAIEIKKIETPVTPENITKNHTNIQKEVKTAKQIRAEKCAERRLQKAQKFLNTKLGQWLLKKAIKKAEKKRLKKELKNATPEQAKILREQSEERVKALSGNTRTAAIIAIVGLVLILLGTLLKDGNILSIVGGILIIVALIVWLLDMI